MVESINSNFQIQNFQNKNQSNYIKQKQNAITNPIDSYTMAGLESLGIYNMSLVKNKENFNHKPADWIIKPGTLMKDIEGKKILSPYGKLEYIVQSDGKYETRYYPEKDKPELVDYVEIKNTYDGKLLKKQISGADGYWGHITEYSLEQPNITYETSYSGGKVVNVEKIEELANGSKKSYSKDFWNVIPTLKIRLDDKNYKNSINVSFDSNNIVNGIDITKTIGGDRYSKDITLNKGAVIGISEYKNTTIPNFMERDVLNDSDVLPTDKFDREKLEATAKNSKKDIYSFYGNGRLKEINDKNIKIEFHEDGSQYIREYLDKNTTKTTDYRKDGSVSVHYAKGKTIKNLEISSENKPTYYNISENGKDIRSASFTEEGYLDWCN